MLTIKAVYAPHREEIWETPYVRTCPVDNSEHVNVMFQVGDTIRELAICSDGCAIYVMNDKGKTIASY